MFGPFFIVLTSLFCCADSCVCILHFQITCVVCVLFAVLLGSVFMDGLGRLCVSAYVIGALFRWPVVRGFVDFYLFFASDESTESELHSEDNTANTDKDSPIDSAGKKTQQMQAVIYIT